MGKKRGRIAKILKKEDILRAMRMTRSNRAAAKYLHVSFVTYKRYASTYVDQETGKTLYEMHLNQCGKGIPKLLMSESRKDPPLHYILEGLVPAEHYDPQKIKKRLIHEGVIEEKCARCGYKERRDYDFKVPLILVHKDGNKSNFNLDNLELLCYNCSFLYAISPISEKQVKDLEKFEDTKGTKEIVDWELDDYQKEYFEELGLYGNKSDEDEDPSQKYIDRD